jgi:hypothetical protein
MMVERFQNGVSIPLFTAVLVNSAGVAQTGLVNVTVRVRRDSDGFWLDWFDSVFKAAAWTTLDGPMAEVDATRAAGVYRVPFPTAGYADDKYYARMTSPSAFNVPQEAGAIVGEYVDFIDSSIAAVQADTNDIQTRLPAALSGGRMEAVLATTERDDIVDRVWDEAVAVHLATGTFGRYLGRTMAAETTAAAGSTSTVINTGLTQADDFFNNMQVVVINAAGIAARNIDDYANASGAITVSLLPFTPAISDVVLILAKTGSVPVNTASIATAVWSEALPGVFIAGSAGERLATTDDRVDVVLSTRSTAVAVAAVQADTDDIQTRLPAALSGGRMEAVLATTERDDIVDRVWDEAIAGHLGVGSTGEALNDAASGGATPAAIATAVWSEALPGVFVAGAAGERLATTDDRTDVVLSTRATAAALALVQADTDDIQTRLPATLSAGKMRSQVEGMDVDTLTASALAASAVTEIQTGLALDVDVKALLALLHSNAYVDNTVQSANGTISARVRGFPSAILAAAATDGAADGSQGETSRWTITTEYEGPALLKTHKLVRTL